MWKQKQKPFSIMYPGLALITDCTASVEMNMNLCGKPINKLTQMWWYQAHNHDHAWQDRRWNADKPSATLDP